LIYLGLTGLSTLLRWALGFYLYHRLRKTEMLTNGQPKEIFNHKTVSEQAALACFFLKLNYYHGCQAASTASTADAR
jgi:hypothetical protein